MITRGLSVENRIVQYDLDDGSVWTIADIVSETGLNKDTVYARLKKTRDKEVVFKPPTPHKMRKPLGNRLTFVETRASMWVDAPVEVYWGIPLNPSYMDGVNDKDRYGKSMSFTKQATLMYFRENNRDLWLKERRDR
jgi:hypothetical protein